MKYKAFVTDKENGKRLTIARDYPTKREFVFDLRRNGYAVDPSRVKTEKEFDRIINTTDAQEWHWKPKKFSLKRGK
jgi:hypothetical protein